MSWIVYTTDLPRKPEVARIAALTDRSVPEVVGLLLIFWSWVDEQSYDGTVAMGPRDVAFSLPGVDAAFLQAMADVGWLTLGEASVAVPNFERWMGGKTKRRLGDAKRKRNVRTNVRIDADICPNESGHLSENCPQNVRIDADTKKEEKEKSLPHTPSKEKEKKETQFGSYEPNSAETPLASPAVLTFPCDGPVKTWDLTQAKLDEWKGSFPSLDVLGECRKALQWLRDNPDRRKTARGMSKFLGAWLGRAQERGGSPAHIGASSNGRHQDAGRIAAPAGAFDTIMQAARARGTAAAGGTGSPVAPGQGTPPPGG